ncbi:TonB-dependent receptor [Pseudoxanthomonas helianthi]|uniref:TonB-dependent receptor n=1 Tax=Pseudoxanthomonas helianthi TaxID=1453541 RepID=A0A940X1Y8_9GAMM|nr:TonB-dependent receptor [Pseudoxanthomonas helianthi]MBP3983546.1 TonB-dependent receptor [Pseudoxanthomonas helianthi]
MSTSTRLQYSPLAAALFLAMAAAMPAAAQDAPAQDPNQQKTESAKSEAKTLDTVAVTGSRIKRSEIEGPAPVTVITGEQMKKEGFATVYDALQTITEAIGNVEQDYNWGQSSVNASPLNLRNLGPGRSLLLINGHRVADYPMPYQGKSNFANFNNIPSGIVERIEVLSGSASAIYGSDAMGGVVNVILKESADEHQLRIRLGDATRGGRKTADVVLSGGFSGDKWNLVYNLQHFDRGELLAGDRPFMDSEDDKPYLRWGPGERHFGIASLTPYTGIRLTDLDNIGPTGRTNIGMPAGACSQYGNLYYAAERLGYDRNTNTEYHDGQYCAQRVFQNWALRTGSQDDSLYLHGTYDFSDSLQGWANLGVWKSTGRFNSFLDAFGSGAYWDPRANGGAGGSREMVKWFSPQEFGGRNKILTLSDELALDFSAGVKGTLADRFDWEASVGRATYEVKESFPVYNQGDMFDYFMGAQQGTQANVRNPAVKLGEEGDYRDLPIYSPDYNKLWNPISPGDFATFTDRGEKKARSWLTQAQFTISGDLFEGWAGPIGFAGVLEAGKQGYKLTPEPKTLNCDADCWYTPFGNIEQGGGERNRYAAGVEFRVPLLETLTANIAGRYDKYDAVRSGAKFTYQTGLEWRPFDTLLVRGSYGTSFRAPDMHFVYAKASSGISDFTDYVACAKDPAHPAGQCPRDSYKIEDAVVNRGGTPDLKYEEGKSWTAGFVWDAFTNFSVTADYWSVQIDNIIDTIDVDELLKTEAYCTQNGFTPDGAPLAVPPTAEWCAEATSRIHRNGPANVAGNVTVDINPINRAETQVEGFDVSARYRLPDTRIGDWSFGLNYTDMLTYKSRRTVTEPLENTRKDQNPRTKLTLSANWTWEKWNATLLMYQKSGGRINNWGGCMPLADGNTDLSYIDNDTCQDTRAGSPTFGQTSSRVYAHREPRRYFNGSVGYQFTDDLKVNFYVSNIFDKIYGDKWCGDFAYCIDDPVGREVALELVAKFK